MISLILLSVLSAANEIDEKLIEINIPQVSEAAGSQSEFGMRYFLGLGVVSLFLFVGIVIVKRLNRITQRKHGLLKMRVLTQLPMGPKRNLSVIEVAGEQILIGVTDHHISLIKSLSLLDEDMAGADDNSFGKVASEIELKGDVEKKYRDFTEEEFSISKISGRVRDQIRSMRPL